MANVKALVFSKVLIFVGISCQRNHTECVLLPNFVDVVRANELFFNICM